MSRFWSHVLSVGVLITTLSTTAQAELRVGAVVTDITPLKFPVIVNGGMTSRSIEKVNTPVNARTIVIDDGKERIAISVVDSCMLPRPLLDDIKALTAMKTSLKVDRILISATHAHSAPSSMGALGTNADENYIPFLKEKMVESFVAAEKNLEPARVGWGLGHAPEYTALRRWIRRPDRLAEDPFGNPTVRANMHAGRNHDDVTGESGPEDPDLSLISFQSPDGRPIALIANFSMHYFGDRDLSADYFGRFANGLKERLAPKDSDDHPPFVGLMSHGCSGDIWRRDYKTFDPDADDFTIESFTEGLLDIALKAYKKIEYKDADIAMAEARMELNYRVPDAQRLQWAQAIVDELGDQLPKTLQEVYAREQVILNKLQSTEIVVQGVRIGDIGIATTPNETYALTGLKLKLNSPFKQTMVIELANGGDGYIPPPEQHHLGGYNTWAARSAGLEIQAEPKIAAAGLHLLEQVAGKPAKAYKQANGPSAQKILDLKPEAYWRMAEMAGPIAEDISSNEHHGTYEAGVVYFLDGPHSDAFCKPGELNRTAHFAGGRMVSKLDKIDGDYTVSMWIWNGMPTDAREVTGWMFSHGRSFTPASLGEHLGIGGVDNHPGQLLLSVNGKTVAGKSQVERWTWNHIVMTSKDGQFQVYLNGNSTPEIDMKSKDAGLSIDQFFIGGRCDNESNWEGRVDEVALFNRALTPAEIQSLSVK
ncbi:LamG-like jellyroll fold domain-containing protein [Thalassoglobus sp.]|uniref:LamG-like jellyroll fold domain-containing protein n=1 Tax=Thalassoglobus sp. TaxID=2795869 RepID=UPI003AA99FCC